MKGTKKNETKKAGSGSPFLNLRNQDMITSEKNSVKHNDAITVEDLRNLLFSVGDQQAQVHTIRKEKYGEIISTNPVVGLRLEVDDEGQQHILIQTR